MKRIIIILSACLFLVGTIITTNNLKADVGKIETCSPTGWTASNGQLFASGLAYNVCDGEDNGKKFWRFTCEGDGMCYNINGNNLTIYLGDGHLTPCQIFVVLHEN